MPTHISFTDGNNNANLFIKELYIGSDWNHVDRTNDPDKMVLYQAIGGGNSPQYFIGIGIHSSFIIGTGMQDGFMVSNNGTSSPIKLEGVGIFAGVDCYAVVDWSQVNGSVWFDAEVDMDAASDINNSPTIKKYVYEQALGNFIPPSLPTIEFQRTEWTAPQVSGTTVNVSTKAELLAAIKNYNNITINLQADIPLSRDTSTTGSLTSDRNNGGSLNTLINIDSKSLVINGGSERHKIYEYEIADEIQATLNGNRYYASYNNGVTGNEAFMTAGGTLLPLARSGVYRSLGWIVGNNNRYGFSLPSELFNLYQVDTDNVFICYGLNYRRYVKKIAYATYGVVFFDVTDADDETLNDYSRNMLTPYPYFFLVNYAGDGDGILIKNGQLSFPASLGVTKVSPCWAEHLFRVKSNAHMVFNRVSFIGGTDYSVRNDGRLRVEGCSFSNCIAGGISNLRQLFVVGSSFSDIKTFAVRFDHLQGSYTHTPYMEVTGCTFRDIGHYGTNTAAVWSTGKAYIADNEFIDTNYCAIHLGRNNYDGTLYSENIVERNRIHHTPEWRERRQGLGLQNSGDIYIVTNNAKAVIRYNRIIGAGGTGKNNAIYANGGAYNLYIYCNVISCTENYYDIDSRDVSELVVNNSFPYTLPSGRHVNMDNYIAHNVCDGKVRIQENTHETLANGTGCEFIDNYMLPGAMGSGMPSGVETGNVYNEVVHCEESDGITTHTIAAATFIKLLEQYNIDVDNSHNDI